MEGPIAAIATPIGKGAIGIVRMSGRGVLNILGRVWKSDRHPVDKFITHRLYLGNITDFSTGRNVDKVMTTLMRGPNSYTGEDVVEVSCHGGPEVMKAVLNQLIRAGARMAEPGEFTKRAFLNGKMDLAQAEAVANLIESRSLEAARIAEEQLEGRLSTRIREIKEELKGIVAYVEATIDFPEEEVEFIREGGTGKQIAQVLDRIEGMISSYDTGKVVRDGVRVVIAGPPNAGKSSLLNAILGSDRAIVHHAPGTTRDTIEEEVVVSGVLLRLVDTAGVREVEVEVEAEVEEMGVEKAKAVARKAEVVLLVVDGHDFVDIDKKFMDELRGVGHVIVVINKIDLGMGVAEAELKGLLGERPIYKISAKTGEGIGALCSGLVEQFMGGRGLQEGEGLIVTSRRHLQALTNAKEGLIEAGDSIGRAESAEFVAVHLRRALDSLGEILGEVTTDEILDEIFSTFCIGK